jgi:hypothetical protein
MKRRGFLASVAAVLTGRRLASLLPEPAATGPATTDLARFVTFTRSVYGAPVLTEAMMRDFARVNEIRSMQLDANLYRLGIPVRTKRRNQCGA